MRGKGLGGRLRGNQEVRGEGESGVKKDSRARMPVALGTVETGSVFSVRYDVTS